VTGTIRQFFTMRQAVTDARLLGHVMPGETFLPHRVLAIAAMGEPLIGDEENACFEFFTRRKHTPGRRVKEFATIGGRGSGKTVLNGLMATYMSGCVDYSHLFRKGEIGVYLCLAQTQQVAKQLLGFVESNLLGSELLAERFVRRTAEMVELTNNIQVQVRPASGKKLRGPRFIGITADELAHWQVEEYYQDPDIEILNAAKGGLATVEQCDWGIVTMASSPSIRRGVLWDCYDKYYGSSVPTFEGGRTLTF
jgi:phage terminase large subunit-like protein